MLAVGLLGIMIGLTRLDVHAARLGNGVVFGALASSLAAFVALVPIERRAREPVIAPRLFAGRQLAVTYGLEVLIGLLEGALFFIPAALVAAAGLNYAAAGAHLGDRRADVRGRHSAGGPCTRRTSAAARCC